MKNFKKILATVLAVLFVASVMVVSVSAASSDQAWYKKAVDYLDGLTITDIGSAGEEEVSRDEFVTWVAKIESHQLVESAWTNQEWVALLTFDDVTDSEHKGAIGYSVGREFIVGNGDKTFTPHATVTLAEAAAVIVRMMDYENRVTGETWEEQKANYLRAANSFCGAFDATFLEETGIYDPNHKLTKGEAAYILYTIMNGAAWEDGELDDDETENLNLTYWKIDLGRFFATNGGATVKAQFVIANVPLVYTEASQLRTFARHDAYVTGATYESLFANKLYESNGILDTTADAFVILQNITTGYYIDLPASVFAKAVKKAAGHDADDDTTNALNYVELGGVVTLTTTKDKKENLAIDDHIEIDTADEFKNAYTSFKINDSTAADSYIGVKEGKKSDLVKGNIALGWKQLGTSADGKSDYTRLTSTPATWTNVEYNKNGVPTNGTLVIGGESYTVVEEYTGKANEIKVYAPWNIFDLDDDEDDFILDTTKTIVSVVGRVGDKVYAGGQFSDFQLEILNLHRHVKDDETYYTRKLNDSDKYEYTAVDFSKTPFNAETTYYIKTTPEYREATKDDYNYTVNAYTVAETKDTEFKATKTYYVPAVAPAEGYVLATLADFTVNFKANVDYYIYDGDDYVKNDADYDPDVTYYLKNSDNTTTIAGPSDFTSAFKAAPMKYYEATKTTSHKSTNTYFEMLDEDTKALTPTDDAVTKTWVGKVYYTYDGADYTQVNKTTTPVPDPLVVYYLKDGGAEYVEVENIAATFKVGKNYYTAAAAAGDVNVDKLNDGTYYINTATAGVLKKAAKTDFDKGFKAATNYYTYDAENNMYPLNAAAFDATKTYFVETDGENSELKKATDEDFEWAWKAGTDYYEVTKLDQGLAATVYSGTPGDYYVDDETAGQIKLAVAADFEGRVKRTFIPGVVYYEKLGNAYVTTEDEVYNPTKTYYIDSDYSEFFDGNEVKTTFTIQEYIPSFVAYELEVEGGAFVTNTSFNIVSNFIFEGRIDWNVINTANPLTVKEALQLILGPAQGETNLVLTDTDGDGAYDIAVVTESTRALYYNEINSSGDVANEGYLGGNESKTREIYDSFGNYIFAAQGLKGHNIGGLLVDSKANFGGTTGGGTDGWTSTSTATNKVQLVVCFSNERQIYGWNNDTSQYGPSNVYPYGSFDVADLTTGYIQDVAAKTVTIDEKEYYAATVALFDSGKVTTNTTTVYIPVEPEDEITLPVTVDKVTSYVTFQAGKSLLKFVSDHKADKEIGIVQDGSWMAGHTVKYAAYENGVAWCMVDTAEKGAVTGYVAGVEKTKLGDNTYKVTVVASTTEGSKSATVAATKQIMQSKLEYSVTSIQVVNSFGIDALFAKEGEMTVTAYKTTPEAVALITFDANGYTIGNNNFGTMFTIPGNNRLTGLYFNTANQDPDGETKPYWVANNNMTYKDDIGFGNPGVIISAYDYELYVKPEYKNDTYFTPVEYDAYDLFGYIDWTKHSNITESQTTTYIGGSVKTLDVKGSATAVWIYDTPTYNLINSVLVKGTLVNTNNVADGQVVSQKDLIYLSFTKDAGAYYTIDGLDTASYTVDYDTGKTDWGAVTFSSTTFVQAAHNGYRAGAYFGYRYALKTTGAGTAEMWTNVGDFKNHYVLGYTKTDADRVNVTVPNSNPAKVKGYYDTYNMVVGENPYYVRNIDAEEKTTTYTLKFTTVYNMQNVKGYFDYKIDTSKTLLVALINQATLKQEVDDGVSYKNSPYYVDENGLVYYFYDPVAVVYDTTKTTSETPRYDTTGATKVEASIKANQSLADIKTNFDGLEVKETEIVSLSFKPYAEDEDGYVPGLFHAYLTNGLGTTKTFSIASNVKIAVIHPNSKTGDFDITVTTAKALYDSKSTVFVTDYQYDGSATSCTMLSVIGALKEEVQTPDDPVSNDTVSAEEKLVYLNADTAVIAEAIQLGNYWVIRSTSSAIDVTTGEEIGAIQFVFTTYTDGGITDAQNAIKAGGYFLINSSNDVVASVKEGTADKYGTKTQYAEVLKGVITNVTSDGKTTATIKDKANTDISGYTFKFLYHDTDGANFGIGGSNTKVSLLTTAEIEATWAADAKIVAEGVNVATHYYTEEDVETAKADVAAAKVNAIDSYLNGTFWNVELSAAYNYFVSQRVSYQEKGEIKLTFNYVVIDDVYYVFVNSFTK